MTVTQFLANYREYIVIGHVLGMTVGLGGATITDFLFFKFLKDYKISKQEHKVLRMLSQAIWIALTLSIITGICLYIPAAARLNSSPKFLTKMTMFAILLINGTLLNIVVDPQLTSISFADKNSAEQHKPHRMRKLAFALGAVSITTWYSIYLLAMSYPQGVTYLQLISIYVALLVIAVLGSQVYERMVSRRKI